MNRKEIYAKIKEYNLAGVIKDTLKENYTRVPSATLESFISKYVTLHSLHSKKHEVVKNEEMVSSEKTPLAKLVEVLHKKHILLKSEVDYIL